MKTIVLDGLHLTTHDIVRIARNESTRIRIAPEALKRVRRGYLFVKEESKEIVYGVNTGFGPMASRIVAAHQQIALQENLVRSHAAGMGDPLPASYVRAAMVVRLNTLLRGHSGVSPALVTRYAEYLNLGITPIVPEHGAVGTSGDLVQLAHIALGLMGEGEAIFKGKQVSVPHLLRKLHITPYRLEPKEGLSLINGTSVMTGIGALVLEDAAHLLSGMLRGGALALELVHAFTDSVAPKLHALRPHRGQREAAEILRDFLSGSKLVRPRTALHEFAELRRKRSEDVLTIPAAVQEVYSLRCMPQIIGPTIDTIHEVRAMIEREANAVTDNPIVDFESRSFLHGGNFHGEYVAGAMDRLKAHITKITMLLERQINFFLVDHVNKSFPPFLNLRSPGLTLALQGIQFVATSTTADSQSLSYPHAVHSIPTNADNQDIVSMGTDATLMAGEVNKNCALVLTIAYVVYAQAVDCHSEAGHLGKSSRALYRFIRTHVPAVTKDRSLQGELEILRRAIGDADWLSHETLF